MHSLLFFLLLRRIIQNRSLERICLDLLLPPCSPTALVRLPTYAQPLHLAVARYALDETSAHLVNNRTKSVKDSHERFVLNNEYFENYYR